MIRLHTFGPFMGAADPSPFVLKAMALLRMAGAPYRTVVGNPLTAPHRLLPIRIWLVGQGGKTLFVQACRVGRECEVPLVQCCEQPKSNRDRGKRRSAGALQRTIDVAVGT